MTAHLEKSILATLVYFDIFDYPLTLVEIHRLLLNLSSQQKQILKQVSSTSADRQDDEIQHDGLNEVRNALGHSQILQKNVHFKNGYFYSASSADKLRGGDKILNIRHERYIVAKRKFDCARRILNIIAKIPFVRAIFVCNSLAYNNTKKKSDIDLIIVAKKHGVWWARLFCVLLLSIMRVRPTFAKATADKPGYKNMKDKICLSVFVDEDHLDFSNLRMSKRDIDFMYWVSNFYPIYDADGIYIKFWEINSKWLNNNLVNARSCAPHPSRVIRSRPFIRIFMEFVLRPFSIFAEFAQKAKFPKQIRELKNLDTRVRVEDGLLKFHVNDRRMEHLEMFVRRYESIIKIASS